MQSVSDASNGTSSNAAEGDTDVASPFPPHATDHPKNANKGVDDSTITHEKFKKNEIKNEDLGGQSVLREHEEVSEKESSPAQNTSLHASQGTPSNQYQEDIERLLLIQQQLIQMNAANSNRPAGTLSADGVDSALHQMRTQQAFLANNPTHPLGTGVVFNNSPFSSPLAYFTNTNTPAPPPFATQQLGVNNVNNSSINAAVLSILGNKNNITGNPARDGVQGINNPNVSALGSYPEGAGASGLLAPATTPQDNLLAQIGLASSQLGGASRLSLLNNPDPGNVLLGSLNNNTAGGNTSSLLLDAISSLQNPSATTTSSSIINNKRKEREDYKKKPKRPLSAYNLFFKYERARILDSVKKEEVEDKDSNHDENITAADEDGEVKNKAVTTLDVLDPNATSDADVQDFLNAYSLTTVRKKKPPKKKPHGKITFENLAKTIGERWSKLSAEEHAVYKKMADEDMARYKQENDAYLKRASIPYSDGDHTNSSARPPSQSPLALSNPPVAMNNDVINIPLLVALMRLQQQQQMQQLQAVQELSLRNQLERIQVEELKLIQKQQEEELLQRQKIEQGNEQLKLIYQKQQDEELRQQKHLQQGDSDRRIADGTNEEETGSIDEDLEHAAKKFKR